MLCSTDEGTARVVRASLGVVGFQAHHARTALSYRELCHVMGPYAVIVDTAAMPDEGIGHVVDDVPEGARRVVLASPETVSSGALIKPFAVDQLLERLMDP